MLEVKTLIRLVRNSKKDNYETQYSDYEILHALNMAVQFFVQSPLLQDTDFLEAVKFYDEDAYNLEHTPDSISFTTDGVELPDDFQMVTGVTTEDEYSIAPCYVTKTPKTYEYKVIGNKIFCGSKKFTLNYKRTVLPVANVNGSFDLQNLCMGIISSVGILILDNAGNDAVLKAINDFITMAFPTRKYNNANNKGKDAKRG